MVSAGSARFPLVFKNHELLFEFLFGKNHATTAQFTPSSQKMQESKMDEGGANKTKSSNVPKEAGGAGGGRRHARRSLLLFDVGGLLDSATLMACQAACGARARRDAHLPEDLSDVDDCMAACEDAAPAAYDGNSEDLLASQTGGQDYGGYNDDFLEIFSDCDRSVEHC